MELDDIGAVMILAGLSLAAFIVLKAAFSWSPLAGWFLIGMLIVAIGGLLSEIA